MNDPQQDVPRAVTTPAISGAIMFGLTALALTALGTPGPISWPVSVICGLGAGVAALHTAVLSFRKLGRSSSRPPQMEETHVPVRPALTAALTVSERLALAADASSWPALPLPQGWTLEPEGRNVQVCRSDRRRFLIAPQPAALSGLQAGVTGVVWRPEWPEQPTRQGRAWQIGGPPTSLIAFLEVL